jgi:hypothetical protein
MRRLLLFALLAGLLAGCGGSDSEDDGGERTSSASSSSGYVRRVDALCLPQTFETFATLLRRAVAVSDRLEAGLREVEPPARERAFHEDLLDSAAKGAENLRRQVSAAQARDSVRLRELSVRGSVLNAEAKGLVAGHGGFRSCGKG